MALNCEQRAQKSTARVALAGDAGGSDQPDLIIPNPKLKLMDQVREVMRSGHYSIRTAQYYCDWIRRILLGTARTSLLARSNSSLVTVRSLRELTRTADPLACAQVKSFKATPV